jgi:hypothetical protein
MDSKGIRTMLSLFRIFFAGWLLHRAHQLQSVCFVWHSDQEMISHVFTTGQVVGEIWTAAYMAAFWVICWTDLGGS